MADIALLPPADPDTTPPYLPELAGKALNVPTELILQLACGMEDPVEVARRFGFSDVEFGALCQWQPFRDRVEAKRAELKQSGYTFRQQNAFFAEDLSKDLYLIAKSNEVPFSQKLDAYRTFTKFADLEPKPQAQVQQGNGFSVNIVFNDTPKGKIIDAIQIEGRREEIPAGVLPEKQGESAGQVREVESGESGERQQVAK